MLRRRTTARFRSDMKKLTSEQRIAVQELAAHLANNPNDDAWDPTPVVLDADTRELETAGVWIRYRVSGGDIFFLRVTPFLE